MPAKPASSRGKALKGKVSVVIPVEPGGSVEAALKALKALPKAEKTPICEVLVAEGRNPSRQRNLAVAQAKGEFVHFLDSDSRLEPGSLVALLNAAKQMKAAAVGGPNLPLEYEPFWGRTFQLVIGSWLGSMASRSRYKPVGYRRVSGEKELILCNLLADKNAFLSAGGFNEALYPNEENELFNRMQTLGQVLVYEPSATVRRPRRESIWAFAVQAFRYGRGRAQQMRSNFFASDLVNLLPLSLWFLWGGIIHCPSIFVQLVKLLVGIMFWMFWIGIIFYQGVELFMYFPMLILRHHAYALGLVVGVFQNSPRRSLEVHVKRIPGPL